MEWATFTTDNNVLFVKDGSTLTNRTFVAVKGSGSDYTIALYDGKLNIGEPVVSIYIDVFEGASATTANITPLTINIVKA